MFVAISLLFVRHLSLHCGFSWLLLESLVSTDGMGVTHGSGGSSLPCGRRSLKYTCTQCLFFQVTAAWKF